MQIHTKIAFFIFRAILSFLPIFFWIVCNAVYGSVSV